MHAASPSDGRPVLDTARACPPPFCTLPLSAAGSFRGRTADFLWMLLLGGALMSAAAPYVEVQFLGSSLTFMMVYVWARRHQYVTMSLLGLFTFTVRGTAPQGFVL
eukprot:349608-Chlamydomonas_euryale.AAC.16